MAITAHTACGANAVVSQCQCRHDGLIGWLELAPDANGQQVFCYAQSGEVHRLIGAGVSIRSRVNEYGGRAWVFYEDGIIYVDEASQQLYYWGAFSQQTPYFWAGQAGARYCEPCVGGDGSVVAIETWHDIHRIVRFDAEGKRSVLREGDDFYAGLALSVDNDLVWVSWQHPQQPWTATSLWFGTIVEQALSNISCIKPAVSSIQMPSFAANGDVLFLDDSEGFWQLYRFAGGEISAVQRPSLDMANAPWQSGIMQYGFDASGHLWSLRFSADGVALYRDDEELQPPGATQIRELCILGHRVVCIHAGPTCMNAVSYWQDGEWMTIWRAPLPSGVSQASLPVTLQFTSSGMPLSGYWYAPPALKHSHPDPQAPLPLIINLHGGPTAAAYPVYNPVFQFWNDHGFAVLDLNYRGSSNQGRDYRMQLKHCWGISDVEDIRSACQYLIKEGWVAADKLFIRGRSSGGYSVLMALLNSTLFCAAGVYFGVSDPASLNAQTHKFERCYLPWLLGNMDEQDPNYLARVPAKRADDISTPVIFFQGLADKVVTPQQTAGMAAAIQGAGGRVETIFFASEGHGFREPENNVAALNAELAFYREAMKASS